MPPGVIFFCKMEEQVINLNEIMSAVTIHDTNTEVYFEDVISSWGGHIVNVLIHTEFLVLHDIAPSKSSDQNNR